MGGRSRWTLRAIWAAAILVVAGAPAALLAAPPALGAGASASAQITRVGPASASQPLELVLPLKADLAGLKRQALAVSTPGSSQYRDYQSLAQLARRYGAQSSTRGRVLSYLRRVGARRVRIDPTGLFAQASMTAALATRLFATPLAQFRSAHGARFVAPSTSTGARRMPAALRGLVTGVVGLDTRPVVAAPVLARVPPARPVARAASQQASSGRARSGTPSGCAPALDSGGFTPNQYLSAYGYSALQSSGITGAGERVALIEIDGFKDADIKTFARCFGLPIPELRVFTVGLHQPLSPGGESTLDLEVLDTAAPGLRSIDLFEAGASAADALEALTAPLRVQQKPQVISVSLGLCERALHNAVGDGGIFASEGALEMATASGITLLAATGDQGSAACTRADGTPIDIRAVSYPASSWWVTGVGGTNLVLDSANQIAQQIVWNDTDQQPGSAGGGGLSELFKRPNYQNGISSARNRAVPDVSMLADIVPGYAIYCSVVNDCIAPSGSPWVGIGGTSAATPLLAGGVALVDQELRQLHRRSLGLVNPLLYAVDRAPTAAASVFDDVTSIGNDVGPDIPGTGQPLGCCLARVGYDQASGLGSMNLTSFASVAAAQQPAIVSAGLVLPRNQKPVRSAEIRATVGCSGPCLMGAYAEVAIGRSKPFEVDSRVFRLRAVGRKTIPIEFSSKQRKRLRSGLAAHKRIKATVRGVVIDPSAYGVLPVLSASIQSRTAGRSLAIGG
jgi:subtilase family serine protease